ncbi:MAG: GNAT family N-acetyltransferase [Myxococcota bacterium]
MGHQIGHRIEGQVPRLETDRLVLRGRRLDDFDACAEMWSLMDTVRYISGVPRTREETWKRFLSNIGHWPAIGYGYWAVADKATDRLIGEMGFLHSKRDAMVTAESAPLAAYPEAGWALHPSVHGTGRAREAMTAVLEWADRVANFPTTVCAITHDNAASIRLADQLGYKQVTRIPWGDTESLIYRRERPSS